MSDDPRKPHDWPSISRTIRDRYGRCSHCYTSKEDLEVHHTCYYICGVKIRLWGDGWWLFPLCKTCHSKMHSNDIYKRAGTKAAHNTKDLIWKLRLTYWLGKPLEPLLRLINR